MNQNGKKVLLIEDDKAIIDVYETIFKKDHFDVEVISWGKEAIKKMEEVQAQKEAAPDIVLLDLILPDINGVEVLKTIKTNNITKNIIVFVLTNQESPELQQSTDIKPDKFIIKANVTPTQLSKLIKEQLKLE
ncbi:MAG: response regulator [Patescibacteria group bacterium]